MKENPLAMKSGDRIMAAPSRVGKGLGTTLERQYQALLSAFAKQEQTMKKVAEKIRAARDVVWRKDEDTTLTGVGFPHEMDEWADALYPREPIAEADAAEKLSETRKK
jgi:hypothetical protein